MIEIAGYLSGVAILLSFVPYIRDVFLHKTKPERISWLIWSILGLISFFSQWAKGGEYSLILTGAQVVGDFGVFLLALKFGLGGFFFRDKLAIVGMATGLLLWFFTKEPLFALFIAILIDAIGVWLTVMKTFEQPETETTSAWWLTLLGGFFGLLAVDPSNRVLFVFPIYICFASTSILLAIYFGKQFKKKLMI
ncbi:MAG: hypothetical protein WCK11_02640 [Candidatus Falkowbacteria bacterium]